MYKDIRKCLHDSNLLGMQKHIRVPTHSNHDIRLLLWA